jgi:hypothetical protein
MLFVSTMSYVMGKLFGIREAADQFSATLEGPVRDLMPVQRTFCRLRQIDTIVAYVDTVATYIGKGRSRAMDAFLEAADADVWVSVDDDVEASMSTLWFMVEACRRSRGLCHVPTLQRQASGLAPTSHTWVRSVRDLIVRPIDGTGDSALDPRRGAVVPFDHAGFGLVAIHREAIQQFVGQHSDLAWDDDDGKSKNAAFFPLFENRQWFEEDFAFYRRLPTSVAREALVTGDTFHDGEHLDLADWRDYMRELEPLDDDGRGPPTLRPA